MSHDVNSGIMCQTSLLYTLNGKQQTMAFFTIKFEYSPIKSMFGKKTGKFRSMIGTHEIEGTSKETLMAQVNEFMKAKTRYPSPDIFQHGKCTLILSVVNTCNEWSYSFAHMDTPGKVVSSGYVTGSRNVVLANAITHLIEMSRNKGEYNIPDWAKQYLNSEDVINQWKHLDNLRSSINQSGEDE
jgi:hypothetical protein